MTTPTIALTFTGASLLMASAALAISLVALCRASGARGGLEAEANDLRRRLANQAEQSQIALDFQRRALARIAAGSTLTAEMILEERLWEDLEGPDAAKLVAAGALPLDVRTSSEVKSGMIPGAVHIPLDALESRIQELPRDKPILIYCAAGARSAEACQFLSHEGFEEVSNLAAGFPSWPQSS